MGTFIVFGQRLIRETVAVEATDRRDAVRKFKEAMNDERIIPDIVEDCTTDEDWEVIGFDETTGDAIFDGEEYCVDSEGIMWLPEADGSCGCEDDTPPLQEL